MFQLTSDINTGVLKLEVSEELETIESPSIVAKNVMQKRVQKTQPHIDPKLVQDFLDGEYCLHGVSIEYIEIYPAFKNLY